MSLAATLSALALGACALTTGNDTSRDFTDALVAADRSPDIREDEDIYAPLLGVWDVAVRDRAPDGAVVTSRGEWLFARVLEGRAVQDVWIDPIRSERSSKAPAIGNRYGSSLRTFDSTSRRWQVTWLNPVTGAFDVLYSRREHGELVQEGVRSNGQKMRWTFKEVTDTSFHWTGEAQQTDGTWRLEAEFFGTRRPKGQR